METVVGGAGRGDGAGTPQRLKLRSAEVDQPAAGVADAAIAAEADAEVDGEAVGDSIVILREERDVGGAIGAVADSFAQQAE